MVDLCGAMGNIHHKDLRGFIPIMLRKSTGRVRPGYGQEDSRPIWWPHAVPFISPSGHVNSNDKPSQKINGKGSQWTMDLRNIVQSCYEYHQQEHMLDWSQSQNSVTSKKKSGYNSLPECGQPPSPPTAPGDAAALPTKLPQPHSTHLLNGARKKPTNQTKQGTTEAESSFIEVFLCCHCEHEFESRSELLNHHKCCSLQPPDLHPPGTPYTSPHSRPAKLSPKVLAFDSPRKVDKATFIEGLGLERRGASRKRRDTTDVDCEIIDLDEAPIPQTPTTPRTPRSLISQLSTPLSRQNSQERDSDTQSEGGKSDISDDDVRKPGSSKSLLNIDVTSLLGQRIKKHLSLDYLVAKIHAEYDRFCRTPVKNEAVDRLRFRGNIYQVTFKPKRTAQKFCHEYKFTQKERREFAVRLRTGLNRRSRKLAKQTKPCKVILSRLNKRELAKWKAVKWPKVPMVDLTSNTISVFPPSPQPGELCRLLGMRTRRDRDLTPEPPLTLSQVVSEDMHGEVTQQQVLMYKTVLSSTNQRAAASSSPVDQRVRRQLPITDNELTPPPSPNSTTASPPTFPEPACESSSKESTDRPAPPRHDRLTRSASWYKGREPAKVTPPATQAQESPALKPVSILEAALKHAAPALLQPPTKRKRQEEDDDVIFVSSSSEAPPPAKKPRTSKAVLFKCRLCKSEIICRGDMSTRIRDHFAEKHSIGGVRLVDDGNCVTVVSTNGRSPLKQSPPNRGIDLDLTPPESKSSPIKSVNSTDKPNSKTGGNSCGIKGQSRSCKRRNRNSLVDSTKLSEVICLD